MKASSNAAELKHESEINKLLSPNSVEVTKMLDYVPGESGTGYLRLPYGYSLSGFSYMVMPAMGSDLVEAILQANKEGIQLSWEAKQYLCSQVVHCLHYLNVEKQLAHLDVKAENFVFNDQLGVSLIDFGMTEGIGALLEDINKMSPKYRAPEILERRPYMPGPADIFGLGVCLF